LRQKKVVNLIQVTSPDQISLKVRIAEVARTALREFGMGFLGRGHQGNIGAFPGALFQPFGNFRPPETTSQGAFLPANLPPTGPDLGFSSLVNFFISDNARRLGLFIRAMESRGDLKTLAEPRIVTQSGQKANFLVGGEFPIPIPQSGAGGSITIEFKPFGVRLEFTPQLKGKNRDLIELKLAPEVSELDFSKSITISGFSIPTLNKRRVETVVELKDRQTFAIAGLIQNRLQKDISKIPWVGDIPILGKLFTSPRFNREETELLVLITPEIMKHSKSDDPMPLKRGVNLGRGM
jgi:pilus assembly protein CpaC